MKNLLKIRNADSINKLSKKRKRGKIISIIRRTASLESSMIVLEQYGILEIFKFIPLLSALNKEKVKLQLAYRDGTIKQETVEAIDNDLEDGSYILPYQLRKKYGTKIAGKR